MPEWLARVARRCCPNAFGGDAVDGGLTDQARPGERCRRVAGRWAGVVVVCLVGLLGLRAMAASPALAVQAPTRTQVQNALNQLVAAGAPAVSAEIRGPRGVERYAAGLANVRAGTPVLTRDHFRIGSVTKTFVATIVLRLVAQDKLTLSETVQKWLPGLIPNASQITIRQLLNHTSGIADYCSLPGPTLCSPSGSAMTKRWTEQQLVQLGASAGPTFPPGQSWAYSNTGYVLLEMIIARVTGHTLGQELRQQIYRPLGLRQTSFPTTTAMPRPYSHGYDVSANGSWPRDLTATTPTIAWGAGAMVSTLGNLTTFMQSVMGARLVTKSLLRQMQAPTPSRSPVPRIP
jgi:D-alanyl-D-alanine carboxypeptidase